MADGRGRENLPRSYTYLVASWRVGAFAEICLCSVQIWWQSGRYLHLRRPAQAQYKFGGTVADVCTRKNLPRLGTNLVANWQMVAVVRTCLDPIQI